jgi:PEP-CTERM motif
MMFRERIGSAAALGVAMLIGAGASAPPAAAAYVVTIKQEGPNVVTTGSGSIDLADLTFLGNGFDFSDYMAPAGAVIDTGLGAFSFYSGVLQGPPNFGDGLVTYASSASGDFVSLDRVVSEIFVPGLEGEYKSGSPISGSSAIYDDATFASLGITPGVYVWTWGSGAGADSFTIDAVPEPSTWALLGVGFLGLAAVGMRRRGRRTPLTPSRAA